MTDQHQDKLEKHTAKSDEMMEKLKTSWDQKCASEKDELRDTLEEEHDTAKEALKDVLEKKHQDKLGANTAQLKEACSVEKADFKQTFLEKYDRDI